MKLTTKANLGDTLYFLEKDGKGTYFEVIKEKVEGISFEIYKEEIVERYLSNSCRFSNLNQEVFLTKEEAEKKEKEENNEIKKEIIEDRKWQKEYKKEKALEEINKLAKKNKIKIEIK